MQKLELLLEKLNDNSAFLIQDPLNLRYFTNTNIDTGYLIFAAKKIYFITDFRYIEVAENALKDTKVIVIEQCRIVDDIKTIIERHNIQHLYIESSFQTFDKLMMFKRMCENVVTDNSLNNIINSMRIIKSADEIENIKKAETLTDEAFSHILNYIKCGVSEKDIALEIEFYMRKHGAEGVSFDLIAISGKNTSLPHGVPSDKKVENGDFITMDIGCKVNGYCSDFTRTVAVGSATDEMKKVYNTVLRAQEKALATIKPGIMAQFVDKAARDYIYESGYEGCFGHSTGHGVGLFIHEMPNVSINTKYVLKPGMIITVEPGIYLKDKFGVRIEDLVLVTENGYENLTHSTKDLIIL